MSQHDFPLFSEFRVLLNTSKLTIIDVHVSDLEVGRACFFQPGPSQAKIFSSQASLELLNFCFKPLQAKKILYSSLLQA